MTALADPPQQWNAETATAGVLQTPRPAEFEVVSNLVSADVTRLDATLCSFKDCRSAPIFQAPSRDGRVNFWRMPVGPVRSPIERA